MRNVMVPSGHVSPLTPPFAAKPFVPLIEAPPATPPEPLPPSEAWPAWFELPAAEAVLPPFVPDDSSLESPALDLGPGFVVDEPPVRYGYCELWAPAPLCCSELNLSPPHATE